MATFTRINSMKAAVARKAWAKKFVTQSPRADVSQRAFWISWDDSDAGSNGDNVGSSNSSVIVGRDVEGMDMNGSSLVGGSGSGSGTANGRVGSNESCSGGDTGSDDDPGSGSDIVSSRKTGSDIDSDICCDSNNGSGNGSGNNMMDVTMSGFSDGGGDIGGGSRPNGFGPGANSGQEDGKDANTVDDIGSGGGRAGGLEDTMVFGDPYDQFHAPDLVNAKLHCDFAASFSTSPLSSLVSMLPAGDDDVDDEDQQQQQQQHHQHQQHHQQRQKNSEDHTLTSTDTVFAPLNPCSGGSGDDDQEGVESTVGDGRPESNDSFFEGMSHQNGHVAEAEDDDEDGKAKDASEGPLDTSFLKNLEPLVLSTGVFSPGMGIEDARAVVADKKEGAPEERGDDDAPTRRSPLVHGELSGQDAVGSAGSAEGEAAAKAQLTNTLQLFESEIAQLQVVFLDINTKMAESKAKLQGMHDTLPLLRKNLITSNTVEGKKRDAVVKVLTRENFDLTRKLEVSENAARKAEAAERIATAAAAAADAELEIQTSTLRTKVDGLVKRAEAAETDLRDHVLLILLRKKYERELRWALERFTFSVADAISLAQDHLEAEEERKLKNAEAVAATAQAEAMTLREQLALLTAEVACLKAKTVSADGSSVAADPPCGSADPPCVSVSSPASSGIPSDAITTPVTHTGTFIDTVITGVDTATTGYLGRIGSSDAVASVDILSGTTTAVIVDKPTTTDTNAFDTAVPANTTSDTEIATAGHLEGISSNSALASVDLLLGAETSPVSEPATATANGTDIASDREINTSTVVGDMVFNDHLGSIGSNAFEPFTEILLGSETSVVDERATVVATDTAVANTGTTTSAVTDGAGSAGNVDLGSVSSYYVVPSVVTLSGIETLIVEPVVSEADDIVDTSEPDAAPPTTTARAISSATTDATLAPVSALLTAMNVSSKATQASTGDILPGTVEDLGVLESNGPPLKPSGSPVGKVATTIVNTHDSKDGGLTKKSPATTSRSPVPAKVRTAVSVMGLPPMAGSIGSPPARTVAFGSSLGRFGASSSAKNSSCNSRSRTAARGKLMGIITGGAAATGPPFETKPATASRASSRSSATTAAKMGKLPGPAVTDRPTGTRTAPTSPAITPCRGPFGCKACARCAATPSLSATATTTTPAPHNTAPAIVQLQSSVEEKPLPHCAASPRLSDAVATTPAPRVAASAIVRRNSCAGKKTRSQPTGCATSPAISATAAVTTSGPQTAASAIVRQHSITGKNPLPERKGTAKYAPPQSGGCSPFAPLMSAATGKGANSKRQSVGVSGNYKGSVGKAGVKPQPQRARSTVLPQHTSRGSGMIAGKGSASPQRTGAAATAGKSNVSQGAGKGTKKPVAAAPSSSSAAAVSVSGRVTRSAARAASVRSTRVIRSPAAACGVIASNSADVASRGSFMSFKR